VTCSTDEGDECIQNFGWKNLKGRELGRPMRRWRYDRLDRREIGWEVVVCIHVAQDRV
jgi:hypothetical protein